jgi:predicted ATPase
VQKRSGFFLKAKFDQRMHPIPYAALISAVTQFVHIVVEEGETATLQVREAVGNHVGDGIEALTSIIPELEVAWKVPDSTPPYESRSCWNSAFCFYIPPVPSGYLYAEATNCGIA